MNRHEIEQELPKYEDADIYQMHYKLKINDILRQNNYEYFELIEKEVDRRKAQVNNIFDKD